MIDEKNTPKRRPDVADLLADQFPGHTMQRLRTADGKYRYVYVSSGIQNSFGLDPVELMQAEEVDHHWVHEADRSRFVDELERSARELAPLDIEVRVEAPDGGYRWVRSLGQPRRQEDGSTIWDGVALDVTDRREALEALERTLAEARRSEVAEGRFAYIAAQDLTEPLNELRGTVASLQSADPTDPEDIRRLVAKLSVDFANYEKALLATKNLVKSGEDEQGNNDPEIVSKLTKRQAEIFALLRKGASNRAIAEHLNITEGTVKLHVSAILKTLKAKNRTEAARL